MLAVLFLYVDVMVNLGFPGSSTEKESACNAGNPSHSWARKIPWRRDRLPTLVFLGFPFGSDGKEFTCNVGDLSSFSGLGRSPGEGNGNPLQYSCLENSMDRGAPIDLGIFCSLWLFCRFSLPFSNLCHSLFLCTDVLLSALSFV